MDEEITDDEFDLPSEYLRALMDFNNGPKTLFDVEKTIRNMGTCSRISSPVFNLWKDFLSERHYSSITRIPVAQFATGSSVTASFNRTGVFDEYSPSDLIAVDIVLSRSDWAKSELYGKYKVTVLLQHKEHINEGIVVHRSTQSVCPTNSTRYFVGALNEEFGAEIIRNDQEFTLVVDFFPDLQISRDGNGDFRRTRMDVIANISGLVFHLKKPSNLFDIPIRAVTEARAKRSAERAKRSSNSDCQIQDFDVDFRKTRWVVRPRQLNIRECVGTCDNLLTTNLNSTTHSAILKKEEVARIRNTNRPNPTVCCTPISYSTFHYLTPDRHNRIMVTYKRDMVAEYCGCR